MDIIHAYRIQSFEKAMVDFGVRHCCHGQTNILSMMAEIILHRGKRKLDRVVVWRVWRKKFTADTSGDLAVSAEPDGSCNTAYRARIIS